MPTSIYEDLAPVLQAVKINSAASFSFAGEEHQVYMGVIPTLPGYPSHPLPDTPIVRDLQGMLYGKCYTQRLGDPPTNGSKAAADVNFMVPDPNFVQQLSASNQSQPHWDIGWQIYGLGADGQIFVQKGERQRVAAPGEYLLGGPPGMSPTVGALVTILVQREANGAQPGMYFAYSDTLSDVWDEFALLRFYFHSPDSASPDLIRYLTSRLNKYQVPFRLKGPTQPAGYNRTDAVVLYLAKRYYHITARLIMNLPDDLSARLRKSVPLFSKKLRDGVGLAEEPNTGESFGMHRCRLTAEGIVDAWLLGDQSNEGRLHAISRRFASNNINLEKPYLNPGSADDFDVPGEATIRL